MTTSGFGGAPRNRRNTPTPTAAATATQPAAATATATVVASPTATIVGSPTATAVPASQKLKGVAINLKGTSVDTQQLAQARTAGAQVFRNTLSWAQLEPSQKGTYSTGYVAFIDQTVSQAEQNGLKVIFGLGGSPCWASADPNKNCGSSSYKYWYPPTNANDYGDAMRFLVQRYGNRVVAWEVWNEPNLSQFWGGATPDAAKYVQLVKATRAKNPTAFILAGSLSSTVTTYLTQMYDAGLTAADYNALALHPYVWMDPAPGGSPDDCGYLPMSFKCGVPNMRSIMLNRGDPRGEIWFTEFGWSAELVDEATQATYLQRAYEITAGWSYVKAAVWYVLRDEVATDKECCFGLYRLDGTSKPVAVAFQGVTLP
ncbi:MAG: cellulase family glycosylhydrolase [Chloroflexota bacterium]